MDHSPSQSGFLFRLALIIDGVYRAVAAHIARDRTAGPTIVLVCNDVRRRFFRFARLVELVHRGILPRIRLLTEGGAGAEHPASEHAAQARVSRAKGFLVKMMQAAPWTVAVYASQMHYWLDDPAVASFLTSYPQGRRILRPLWRLLSADPLPAALREPELEPAGVAAPGAAGGAVGSPAPNGNEAVPSRSTPDGAAAPASELSVAAETEATSDAAPGGRAVGAPMEIPDGAGDETPPAASRAAPELALSRRLSGPAVPNELDHPTMPGAGLAAVIVPKPLPND